MPTAGTKDRLTRTHKASDRDHVGLANGTAAPEEHLPRYFGKAGFSGNDPAQTKKQGSGKGNWGKAGSELEDHDYNLAKSRRRTNSFSAAAGHSVLKTKFEAIDPEVIEYEEDVHGPGQADLADHNELEKMSTSSSADTMGSVDEEEGAHAAVAGKSSRFSPFHDSDHVQEQGVLVFDDWAQTAGDPELRWDALLGDFEATSHFDAAPSDHRQVVNKTVYGHGPVNVSYSAVLNGWDPYYFDALKAGLNLPEVDLNDGSALGVTLGIETVKSSNRTRSYALPAYGWQMAGRPNVQMLHGALVSHIGFDGKRATNVTYLSVSDNQTYTVSAREIIVSAGAIGSPKLLMLSGVGPKEHLQALGIPLVQDVPDIGSNLYDHHFSSVEAEVVSDVQTIWQLLYNATDTALTEVEYKANSTGPLGNSDTGSFALAQIPDTVFEGLNDTHYTSLPADRGQLLYQYSTAAFVAGSPKISIVSPFVALVQPEGTGYIRLNSSDFRDAPLI
ncbi:hypothetical protein B0A55_04380 [Friedmanniomyces simplex]|uniref:Glucose-methanol-choline oxidoreductase N-terminal domain-containing protein n=1 Tax=Friedmanniomyces simplex TaxID=329884 RepID=A0A4U0XI63_9PEZI|nr:hypothetical protein B0A55_04380 [Friedmanniomyces simplex]